MSYILDALKRADAERERGQVPGLHSQSGLTRPVPADTPPPTPWWRGRAAGWLVLAAALGGGALYAWLARPAAEQQALTRPAAGAPVAPAPAPAPSTAAPAPTAAPPQPSPPPPLPAAAAAPLLAPPPVAGNAPSAAQPPATRTPEEPRLRRWADLPPEQRAQLPPLSVNGASHSDNPAHRMLIVNGQVFKEGQDIAPGLTLERIGPHEAVLRHGGQRFSIGY